MAPIKAPKPDAVSIPWWFHHESWTTPWSSTSGDFPPEETEREHRHRLRQLRIQPWFTSAGCEATSLLKNEIRRRWPWGYTIYRTVYTPESDLYWDAAVDANTVDARTSNPIGFYAMGIAVSCSRIKTRFDGATIAQVREDFRAFVDNDVGALGNRFRWCLVFNEEALQSFIRYPEPLALPDQERADPTEKSGAWVIVVEPKYEQTAQYSGYMRIHLNRLFRLANMGDVVPMSEMCTLFENIPWYNDF
ncbi:hypothetical protein N7453_008358 [Penicillium expansum]|nr:hypothetical protein N7453_008358 [Penicillium expansum]